MDVNLVNPAVDAAFAVAAHPALRSPQKSLPAIYDLW